MNIVRGVADLLRRSSGGGQVGENASWSRAEKLSAPSLQVVFDDVGEEAELKILWKRYNDTIDKTEKRKLLQAFLSHFIQTYKNWEPVYNGQLPVDDTFSTYATSENSSGSRDVVRGCSFGHPSEVVLILIQEIARLTALVTDLSDKASIPSLDYLEPSLSLTSGAEAFHILNSVTIVTRSMHNCRVFSYYGGVQKVTALMKAVVIQLKTLSGLAVDNNITVTNIEKIGLLEKILLYVVITIVSFMDLDPVVHEKLQYIIAAKHYIPEDRPFQIPSVNHRRPVSGAGYNWQQKAIVLVMEAGGVNWLVELLRVIRRINLDDKWIEWALQYVTLKSLKCALSQNPRAQNHFRSIGGLEVLLDGLSLPSNNHLILNSESSFSRGGCNIFAMFELQILSLEVLRESLFGNLNNLQFISENGRIQKFANSMCSSAFMLQEFIHQRVASSKPTSHVAISTSATDISEKICSSDFPVLNNADGTDPEWVQYCDQLSQVLCSFLLEAEDINPHAAQSLPVHSSTPISFTYWELSIKWFMMVLLSVFPCINACSSGNELPGHLRIFAHNLQHHSLYAFRKFLLCAPNLLEVFREEGIWDFIFSENFFYFGPVLEESFVVTDSNGEGLKRYELSSSYKYTKDQPNHDEVIMLQMEAISFLEFAATLGGNTHNLPECSVLLVTLEQSVCNPEVATILVKSLHRILQLSVEQTVASFSAVDAVGRVLKVACIQAQEYKKLHSSSLKIEKEIDDGVKPLELHLSWSVVTAKHWIECMEASLDLFTEYLSSIDNAKSLILHSTTCIECLFDLFWEERLGRRVLEHILGLMKLPPSSAEDRAAMLQLCSKYLETFTHAKEKGSDFVELSIDLLVGMRDVLVLDQAYYQALFREGECFLHIVSLLNGTLDEKIGEQLVLNVLQTLTFLLIGNDISKSAFKALVGVGYHTLQSLLLDFCQSRPSLGLLTTLLDMLVDGKYNNEDIPLIKNEDVIMLFLVILQKSSNSLQHYGLDILQKLLKDSITNRTICFKSGMLGFLLDWFLLEESDDVISKLAQLIQIIGGHSVSGKDIRKIFAILRSEKIGSKQKYCSLLLTCLYSMLKEKGPTAFFEFSGHNSGIVIKTPVQWPNSKGFSFSCWIRIESFPETGLMSLFCFCTDSGKGSSAMLGKDKLVFESIGQKRQSVSLSLNFLEKKWHFLCITHSIGRAFSGGSLLKCYIDGELISSEKCRYQKITEALMCSSIGTKTFCNEQGSYFSVDDLIPFFGQIGPIYMFCDALLSEQIKGLYLLGPSYMYCFVGNEVPHASDNSLSNAILDVKDGLSSKVIFGLNAQASDSGTLFNVSSTPELMSDKNVFEAVVMDGTRLCSRRILKEIIYCVGGVSVFFPLLTQLGSSGSPLEKEQNDLMLMRSVMSDKLASEIIELVASVLDENLPNQQQMHLLSGFSILGFLFQSVPPQQLNMETLSSLKHLLHIVRSSGMSKLLLKDAISRIYLNPHIWMYVDYKVQRELYMFLIQHFENDSSHLRALCGLPQIIDVMCQFYWDIPDSSLVFGTKPLLHPTTRQVIAKRPSAEEVHKIRLLLLSLAEMSLKQKIEKSDIKALIAFFERSHDMVCIEDVLQMVTRALSQKPLLVSFLEQVNLLGGCHFFINLLQREIEPIRLLGLQFIGKLLVGLPSEKKGQKFFNLSVGRSKSLSESCKKGGNTRLQPIISAISDRLFKFPLSDNLCATLFDALLGGASPKQVLQKHTPSEKNRSKRSGSGSSHFFLPQVLILIFNFLATCKDRSAREKILKDLLDLLDSNPSNIEALMENGWLSWLVTCTRLDVLRNHEIESEDKAVTSNMNEQYLVRNVYCIVLSHYIYSVKGGWQQLEETVNFLLVQSELTEHLNHELLRNIFKDLVESLLNISPEENIFASQPCRDNTLYLLKLADEMLTSEMDDEILFPNCILHADFPPDPLQSEGKLDIRYSLLEILNDEDPNEHSRIIWCRRPRDNLVDEEWWDLYDSIWVLICEINGKGPRKNVSKTSTAAGPTLGQRARGLVESLNVPAAEMAAVVVSGGIGNALGGKTSKSIDKAMLLRGEKCPRIVFRLVMLYITRASLDRASKCVQQFILLLPCLLTFDDEQNKNRLQQYIWYILMVRSQSKMCDGGARFHIVSHLVLEMVNYGRSILATAMLGEDDLSDPGSLLMDPGSIHHLIHMDRVLTAVADEVRYIKASKTDRLKQLQELRVRMDENSIEELSQKKVLEDELQTNISAILSSDDGRRAAYQLAYDENQQTVAEKWIHLFRALIDERGPWSATAFPNNTLVHWKHDKTEDIWRRRPKLKRNYHFDEKLCHPSTTTSSKEASNPVNDGYPGNKNFPKQMKHFLLKGVRGIVDEINSEPSEDTIDLVDDKAADHENCLHDQISDLSEEHMDLGDKLQDREKSLHLADVESSEVLLCIPCVLVTPKRKVAGHLSIMQTFLHFSGEFFVEGTGGSSVFKSLQGSMNLDLNSGKGSGSDSIDGTVLENRRKKIKRHRRWKVTKIKAVHSTRYLLQYTAVEIFFSDSVGPVFLNFASVKDAKNVGTLIVSSRNEALFPKGSSRDRSGVISFVDRRVAVELAETAREGWRRREISNFEYLIILNTLAGRSYNDLTQYPVFPWVLADYMSEKLDFNKSSTFRDLSKPVGALDSKRFEVFEERYRNFCDPDIPSFYYGSHYSSMGIVLFYLLRLEPFTALHRNLQGGKFDHADRLFQSIEGTYNNCLSNTSDVKELTPEFFYMPEFLVNMNSYHIGIKQDGEPLADVSLPPWAKGSPEEFVYRNREALESEFVSSNLHHWIDLVFGYKQRGKPAVEAANVFYYLTYEGAVDLEAIDDELQRSAIEDQIANFGQTPIQIFRKKHPRRGPPIPIAHPLYFAPASITLTSTISNTAETPSSVLFIDLLDSNIVIVNEEFSLTVKMWLTTQLQSGGNFTFSSSQDPSFGIGSDFLSSRKIGTPLAENIELSGQCFATLQTATENYLVSCGSWENSFQLISLNDGRMVQSIRQHKDVVSCIAVTSDGSVLATGSYDTTVMVWDVSRHRTMEKRLRSARQDVINKDLVIVENPCHILCGHDDIITCLFASVELDIVISGSKDGTCIFHTLREGRYVRSIPHPSGNPLSKLVVSQHGRMVVYSENDLSLHMYSINGKLLAFSECNGRLNCIKLSGCGDFLVCAGDHGHIILRSMHSLEIVRRYEGIGKTITSLVVTPEECFLAGTKNGTLLVYSIENLQLRKSSIPRIRS